jgi:hypothetical protein
MSPKRQAKSTTRLATVTIPELEQPKTAVFNTLASEHSWRIYEYADAGNLSFRHGREADARAYGDGWFKIRNRRYSQ